MAQEFKSGGRRHPVLFTTVTVTPPHTWTHKNIPIIYINHTHTFRNINTHTQTYTNDTNHTQSTHFETNTHTHNHTSDTKHT